MKKVKISSPTSKGCVEVLNLQIRNHKAYLDPKEQKRGFVTLLTPSDYLQYINHDGQVLLARYSEGEFKGMPAGYLISVDMESASSHPFLAQFAMDIYNDGYLHFVIIAQIGVARREVGARSGIGTQLYTYFFEKIIPYTNFDWVITEVSVNNLKSYNFHLKMKFIELERYDDSFGNEMIMLGRKVNVE